MNSNIIKKLTGEYKKAIENEWSVIRANDAEIQLEANYAILEREDKQTDQDKNIELPQALKENKNIVLLGEPGSGKSTILQFIGLCFVHEDWHITKLNLSDEYVPIRVNLRAYASIMAEPGPTMERTINLATRDYLRNINEEQASELILSWLNQNKLLILLDGLDEVSDILRGEIREEIYRFSTSLHINAQVIVSTRPSGYSSLGSAFKEYSLKPFEGKENANSFLQAWLDSLRPDWGKEKTKFEADHLFRELTRHQALGRVIDNPLLLRLSAEVYASTGQIASNRSKLYRQYIDDLWERAKKRGADGSLENQVMSSLEILAWQLHTNKEPNIPTELLKIIKEKLGLLVNTGNKFTFSHTTLQEYFVSQQLLHAWRLNRAGAWEFLRPRLHISEWYEPILLMGGGLNSTDSSDLLRRILKTNSPLERQLHRDKKLITALVGEGSNIDDHTLKSLLKRTWQSCALWNRITNVGQEIENASLVKSIRQLGKPAIPLLCKLLKNDDDDIQQAAIDSLVAMNAVEAIPDLIILLKEAELWFIRAGALIALGSLKAKEALPNMLEAIESGDDYWGSMGAMALGNMKDKETIPVLISLFSSQKGYVAEKAAQALANMGTMTIPYIRQVLKNKDRQVRWAAVYALGALEVREVIPDLREALKDNNEEVRSRSITALEELKATEAISDLRQLLANDEAEWVRNRAAFALGELNAKDAVSDLAHAAVNDPSKYVQDAASSALRRLNATNFLNKITPENLMPIAFHALKKQFPNNAYDPNTRQILEDRRQESIQFSRQELKNNGDVRARWAAIEVLEQLNATEAVFDLITALHDNDKVVQRNAIDALGNLNLRDAIPYLLETLNDEDKFVRISVVKSLEKLGGKEVIAKLRELLDEKDKDIKQAVVTALGNLSATESISDLRHVIKDKDLRITAAIALGKLRQLEAIPYLRKAQKRKKTPSLTSIINRLKYRVEYFPEKYPRVFQVLFRPIKFQAYVTQNYNKDTGGKVLDDLIANTPMFQSKKERIFYIRELHRLKRENIESELVTKRLEALELDNLTDQDPFKPAQQSGIWKVLKRAIRLIAVAIVLTLIAVLGIVYRSLEDLFKDASIVQTIQEWFRTYPGVAFAMFISLAVIIGLLSWWLDRLQSNWENKK